MPQYVLGYVILEFHSVSGYIPLTKISLLFPLNVFPVLFSMMMLMFCLDYDLVNMGFAYYQFLRVNLKLIMGYLSACGHVDGG